MSRGERRKARTGRHSRWRVGSLGLHFSTSEWFKPQSEHASCGRRPLLQGGQGLPIDWLTAFMHRFMYTAKQNPPPQDSSSASLQKEAKVEKKKKEEMDEEATHTLDPLLCRSVRACSRALRRTASSPSARDSSSSGMAVRPEIDGSAERSVDHSHQRPFSRGGKVKTDHNDRPSQPVGEVDALGQLGSDDGKQDGARLFGRST